jgi:uncharacterized phage-like protein YoqJ
LEKENEILKIKDDFIEKVVELINKGNPIHLLRGRPLKVENKVLESVFDKLSKYENIFVISIIGQQSSAKSSLFNGSFGCDFYTSSGRCKIGFYLNFVKFKEEIILKLIQHNLKWKELVEEIVKFKILSFGNSRITQNKSRQIKR